MGLGIQKLLEPILQFIYPASRVKQEFVGILKAGVGDLNLVGIYKSGLLWIT